MTARRSVVEERLSRLECRPLTALWTRGVQSAPANDRRWLHGDLHGRNVVVNAGRLVGVIDWGDLTAGDVATDLACIWTLFDSDAARSEFIDAYAPSGEELARAAAWAVNFASALLESREVRHVRMGETIMRNLLEGGGTNRPAGS